MVSIIHGLENRENSLIYGCVNGLYINHYDKLHQKKKNFLKSREILNQNRELLVNSKILIRTIIYKIFALPNIYAVDKPRIV